MANGNDSISRAEARHFQIHVPLQNFRWDGEQKEIAKGIHLLRRRELPDLAGRERELGKDEQRRINDDVTHWLSYEQSEGEAHTAGEKANLFLLALWLTKPSKTEISYRFNIGIDKAMGETGINRLLDRMQWINGDAHNKYIDADIKSASCYFKTLLNIKKPGRLNNAIILTLQGCWQNNWQSALILFSAGVETLLTSSEGRNITHRLATIYAHLLYATKEERELNYRDFKECYAGRSNVIHGRGATIPDADRLQFVLRWGRILRNLWRHILASGALIEALEGTDAQRAKHFQCLAPDHRPPI